MSETHKGHDYVCSQNIYNWEMIQYLLDGGYQLVALFTIYRPSIK